MGKSLIKTCHTEKKADRKGWVGLSKELDKYLNCYVIEMKSEEREREVMTTPPQKKYLIWPTNKLFLFF